MVIPATATAYGFRAVPDVQPVGGGTRPTEPIERLDFNRDRKLVTSSPIVISAIIVFFFANLLEPIPSTT